MIVTKYTIFLMISRDKYQEMNKKKIYTVDIVVFQTEAIAIKWILFILD